MTDASNESVNTAGTPERRARTRLRSSRVIFISLASQNGGVVSDITEDGLGLTVVMPLFEVHLPSIQIRFPGSKDRIEARGQIVWKSQSNKRAGVRFVNLSEDARQQIRNWISSHASGGEFSSAGKVAAFQNVSTELARPGTQESSTPHKNSDISAERRTHDRDRSESPLMALGGPRQGVAKPGQQETGSIASDQDVQENSYRRPDRRLHQRRKILSLAYVEWNGNEGGVAYNLGEGGLALASARVLSGDHLMSLRFQFPGAKDRIEVTGQITWKADSKKRAGVRFVGLTEDARRRIGNWVSARAIRDEIRTPRDRSQGKPAPHDSANLISSPAVTELSSRAASQVLLPPPVAVAPSGHVSVSGPATVKLSPVSRSAYHANVDDKPNLAERKLFFGSRVRYGGKLAALIGLAAVLLLVIGLSAERLAVWNLVRMRFAEKGSISSQSASPTVIATGDEGVTVPNGESASPTQSPPEKYQVTPEREPLVAERQSTTPESLLGTASSQQSSVVTAATTRTSRKELKSILSEPRPRAQATKETLSSAVRLDPPAAIVQPQTVNILPGTQSQAGTEIAPPLTSALPLPNDALPADHQDKESSPLPPRRADIPVNITGSVSIVADRYPSIRTPLERSSKKSPTGTSLQLGHLISRVEPVYPTEAKQQGVEGAVGIHVMIGPDGSVENLVSTGPPLLVPAAVSAVRQWRYTETLVAGRPVETEVDISIKFQLSKPGTSE
jgi:TonB family protein